MIKYLNLPPLPKDLVDKINEYADICWESWEPYSNDVFEACYPENTNFVKRVVIAPFRLSGISAFFYKHLGYTSIGAGLILIENENDTPALFPPHTDFKRHLGLNCVIRDGGSNVETVTYFPPSGVELTPLMYWNESALEMDQCDVVEEGKWYIFDAQKPHAVRNVEGRRVILMIYPDKENKLTLEEFIKDNSL